MDAQIIKKQIQFTIESIYKNVALIGISIRSISIYLGIDDTGATEMELAVVEAVNNAIEHAYQKQPGFRVVVEFTAEKDKITIAVCDTGKTMAELPELKENPSYSSVDDLPENGMGYIIIRSIMDELRYETKHGKNRLIMIKNISSPSL